jgi:hypothetical protein
MSKLAKNLKNPFFSKDREELMNYGLLYSIKKAGLLQNIDFELLEPVIDKNGYDLLIKYKDFMKTFQIKCTEKGATKSWKINKRFFRPRTLRESSQIISNNKADFTGLGGGVILIEYSATENSIKPSYYYCDYSTLVFYRQKRRRWKSRRRTYHDFIAGIHNDSKSFFSLSKSHFIKCSTTLDLLLLSRVLPINETLNENGLHDWLSEYMPQDQERAIEKTFTTKSIECSGISMDIDIFDTTKMKYPKLRIGGIEIGN